MICRTCKITLTGENWNPSHKRRGNYICRLCCGKYNRENYKKIKGDVRNWNLKTRFGISLEDYQRMFEAQNGVCAICGSEETGKNRGHNISLAVDHNHKTGEIRGLLCSKCNQGIGCLRVDDESGTDILLSVISYLKNNDKVHYNECNDYAEVVRKEKTKSQ